ncbi:hypothetical protein K491DRAFT_584270 [Lophiostoma macrostomum CBS 122681]|uniref:Uncharacterized protein n=1 Tax=Lophiostoma macrostomum CBS 122681 TaxID=1314788 RepID=A0A6A6TSS0_9PLEO|nr:hypothetical protein K491DRAFT_584270 [Lophiostoma macrostomum CBS 122681]
MQSLRRTAVSAARKGRPTIPSQSRRYATGHDEPKGHSHAEQATTESMGGAFWGCLALFPAGWALYTVTRQDPNKPLYLTQLIDKYTEAQDVLAAKNDIHTRIMEQAGSDRLLFMSSKPQEFVDMRFPEIMNQGSPYNVPAGSQVNMDKVIAKFQKEAYEDNERKLQELREGRLKAEEPIEEMVGPRYRGYQMKAVTRPGF